MTASAIILAGGKGERLRPYTEDRPKPMVSIMGNPLLAYHLRWLAASGFQRVVMCCGYKSEVIQEFFGDGSKFGVSISYCVEETPLGRGGAIKAGLKVLGAVDKPILAMNGDLMTNLRIDDFRAFHIANGGMATVATVPLKSPYGVVDVLEDGTITSFREKPELPFWINAGIYMFNPEIYDLLPDKGDHETTAFQILTDRKSLKAFRTNAFWRTVDTVKDLTELRSELEQAFFSSFLSSGALPTTFPASV
jgi:NDP-sugar pyrophosphorylase family protein